MRSRIDAAASTSVPKHGGEISDEYGLRPVCIQAAMDSWLVGAIRSRTRELLGVERESAQKQREENGSGTAHTSQVFKILGIPLEVQTYKDHNFW